MVRFLAKLLGIWTDHTPQEEVEGSRIASANHANLTQRGGLILHWKNQCEYPRTIFSWSKRVWIKNLTANVQKDQSERLILSIKEMLLSELPKSL